MARAFEKQPSEVIGEQVDGLLNTSKKTIPSFTRKCIARCTIYFVVR